MTHDKRRGRGPGKKPAMLHVTMRMPRHVVERYPDIKTMRDAWVAYVESLPYTCKETGEEHD